MSGEADLAVLLRNLRPSLDGVDYAFATLPTGQQCPPGARVLGTFEEQEGTTIIAPSADLVGSDFACTSGWARLTLQVHSSFEAVGMTAAIATALAKAGISANVVAAFYHDHLFVPWERRHEALAILEGLPSSRRL